VDRRAFLGTLTGGLLATPLTAEAQQAGKVYRIGYFSTFPQASDNPHWAAFVEGLRNHGYVEGKNLQIERRSSAGQVERLPGLAAELVALGLSVIVTTATGPTRAMKEATGTVPIVFVGVADPVGLGLVTSLARPGGNVTGLAGIEWEAFTAKQFQVIKEALPTTSRVAILTNPTNPMHAMTLPQEQAAADRLNVKLQLVEARNVGDLESAFAAAKRERADLLHVYGDPVTFTHRARIAELALKHRLPTMHFFREAVEAGGLLGLGPDWPLLFRNGGAYVDKILKGAKPADIPVAQPTKYELVINLKTAKALGLTIPPSLLQRADQVIE
jgi:putative tryptophan/tyrosine transport system substrate-binding protein